MDIGTLIGGIAVGYLSDYLDKRALLLSPFLLLSSIVMFLISFSVTNSPLFYYIMLLVLGICIGGPYGIMGTVIAMDIGKVIQEKGSTTKISSLIEGSAAFFTALEMVFIPYIPFNSIFYLFSLECIIAAIILFPLFME